MLFGAQTSSMLQCEHISTFNAVLLSNWNFAEKRKNINLFNSMDLIVFYRSSICQNILGNNLSLRHILNIFLEFRKFQPRCSYVVYSYK